MASLYDSREERQSVHRHHKGRRRRFAEHAEGGKKGSKYLRARRPLTLVFQQKVGNHSQALKVECAVKNLSKPVKEQLAKGNLKLDDAEFITRFGAGFTSQRRRCR